MGVVTDHQYALVAEAYVYDPDTRAFMQQHNPLALRSVGERLLEAMQRGLWEQPGEHRERIAQHLHLVREHLAQHTPEGLSASQVHERSQLLEALDAYADRGVFPKNYVLPYRNPVFIDPHGTACAVGQLMVESGHADLALRIDAEMELAYVREIDLPEVGQWAE